jgi:hypothetical protein
MHLPHPLAVCSQPVQADPAARVGNADGDAPVTRTSDVLYPTAL